MTAVLPGQAGMPVTGGMLDVVAAAQVVAR